MKKALFILTLFFTSISTEIKAQTPIFPTCSDLEVTHLAFNINRDSVYVTIFNNCLDCETHVYTGVIIHKDDDTLAANRYSNSSPNPPNKDILTYKIQVRKPFNIADDIRIQLTGGLCDSLNISDGILGINEFDLEEVEINIFPNPTHEFISISQPNNTQILSVSILNLYGETLKYVENNFSTISINDLSKGTYNLSIKTNKGVLIKKLILN